jgi:tetratricopeptide (TPR) repeat protein
VKRRLIYCCFLLLAARPPGPASSAHLATLLARLDPQSLPQLLAFYELYPETPQGKEALERACRLLQIETGASDGLKALAPLDLKLLVDRFTEPQFAMGTQLPPGEIALLEALAAHLPHRRLVGHQIWSVDELAALDESEVDIARGLLLTFLGEETDQRQAILSYEALLDLLALRVLARLAPEALPADKIAAINHLLFFELGIRFPPHSHFSADIDRYTFLPSVLDKRRGVCLGVSSLYLCLAQRLSLSLEAVTPPGHIYVRHCGSSGLINIETTARGVHVSSEEYLGVQTPSLQTRNLKEVIGLTFMNQGAALWQAGQLKEAVTAYRKAIRLLPHDPQAQEFLGYVLLLTGGLDEGQSLLLAAQEGGRCPNGNCRAVEDLLAQKGDLLGIEAVFMAVDETRKSILAKQKRLQETTKRCPEFRAGWFQLAVTFLQLGRHGEALAALERYHELDPTDPLVEYYLAVLSFERHDFPNAWSHLALAQAAVKRMDYSPRPLRELQTALKLVSPL